MKLVHSDFLKFFGKVGDYVVYEWRGQLCLRRKPREPKPPSSPGQIAQQERMASIAIFYRALQEEWTTSALEVYVFALSKDGKKASNSCHLTVS